MLGQVKTSGRKRFFFEKKKQKTSPGCFAHIVGVGRMQSAARMPAALKLKLDGAASCEARRGEAALCARETFFGSFFQKRTFFLIA